MEPLIGCGGQPLALGSDIVIGARTRFGERCGAERGIEFGDARSGIRRAAIARDQIAEPRDRKHRRQQKNGETHETSSPSQR